MQNDAEHVSTDAPLRNNIYWHADAIGMLRRQQRHRQKPATIWLTGLSGAGKSTLAHSLEQVLFEQDHPSIVLDGDNLRHGLNRDLGFSAHDRQENVRRTAELARLINDAGMIAIAALVSPLRAHRALARQLIGADRFYEVHVCASLEACEMRDVKGLYRRARAGQVAEFSGVSAVYETPLSPDLSINTEVLSPPAAVEALYALARARLLHGGL